MPQGVSVVWALPIKLVKALGDSRFAQRLEEALYKNALTPQDVSVVTPSTKAP
tara:strand:+ start:353 stop:511 length:159 start_codon:yes stop_codon:yes gene_type:complete